VNQTVIYRRRRLCVCDTDIDNEIDTVQTGPVQWTDCTHSRARGGGALVGTKNRSVLYHGRLHHARCFRALYLLDYAATGGRD
jgi:hypothetical protein